MATADKTLVDQIHILLDVPSGQNISFNLLGGTTSDQETENSAMLSSAYYVWHKRNWKEHFLKISVVRRYQRYKRILFLKRII